MIQEICLKNFKSIKNYKFPLRNLNVVMGLNGMGKSTFLQSLLLLRQSSNLKNGELRLNDDYVKIGKGKDAFYQYSKDDEMTFEIIFQSGIRKTFNFTYVSEADFLKTNETEIISDDFFNHSLFNSEFQYINANRSEPKVIHEKSYTSVVTQRNLGMYGQFTIHFLNKYSGEDIHFDNLIHPASVEEDIIQGKKVFSKSLISQVNNWLSTISPGVKLNTTEIQNSENILFDVQFRQPNLGYTNNFRPTNVGFGISYALPIITAILAAVPGQLIIIENPESHIHPRGQAELGKLIALASMNNIQIIVKTHSDHILNGIRVAIKEQQANKDRIVLFFFDRKIEETEQYSEITKVEIDKNGELSEYPKGLLDEWGTLMHKLI